MIAVDVNVIAYLLINGEKTAEARAVHELDTDWLVPDLWRDEFLNILTTYLRQGGTSPETAKELWHTATELFGREETFAPPTATLDLAVRYGLSAYDAQYLAVAIEHDVKLVTEDRALLRAAPQYCVTMREFIESFEPSSSR